MKYRKIDEAQRGAYLADYVYTYPLKSRYDFDMSRNGVKLISTDVVNIYIHVPFCKKKCSFCTLFSTFNASNDTMLEYAKALIEEIRAFFTKNHMENKILDSIYFGGGTPTSLPTFCIEQIVDEIHKYIKFSEAIEISIETTPTDIDLDYLQALKVAGINRISIGVQSLQNNELLKIHRADNIEKIMETIVNVKKCGFYNINTDLIYGLPEQTQESWIDTLQKIIDLGVTTVTMYPLVKKNNLRYDDTCMMTQDKYLAYDLALELLKENKYEQFTFVSFSKCKNGCRHEESFFAGNSTIGFGAGARSYFENVHYCNNNTSGKHASEIIKEYLQNDYSTSVESVMLNSIEKKNKKVLLGLLLTGQGAYIEDFDKDLGQYLLKNKLAYVEQEYIKLTDKGLKYSSTIADVMINDIFCKD